ncbi:MAG: hypothetical protein QNJ67_09250 [Kiloniellales bacterium]|nr:hypothetical protein [Kiloniellales bacterium]
MLSATVGQFFRSGRSNKTGPEIKVGAIYRHHGPGNVVETAKVVEVEADSMGIPHVRYEVLVEQSQVRHNRFAACRTLNLETFKDHFCEAVDPVKA